MEKVKNVIAWKKLCDLIEKELEKTKDKDKYLI
jgi:hypothetical protein